MRARLTAAATTDARIVGLIDYGSGGQGRADAWSDVDVDLFICDADFDAFDCGWKAWAAQFGELLLAYRGGVGHPWTVYAGEPVPLRVDFDFHRESDIEHLLEWPYSPLSVEAMVWYDGSGGRITACAQRLVGQSLSPPDLSVTFTRVAGDFWYYLLDAYCKLRRGEGWLARQMFHFEVMQNLFNLLRIEAGTVEHWRGTPAARHAERELSPTRLAQLEACIPGPGLEQLARSLAATGQIGRDACTSIAAAHGWEWPRALTAQMARLLDE